MFGSRLVRWFLALSWTCIGATLGARAHAQDGTTEEAEATGALPDTEALAQLSLEELLGIDFRVSVASLFEERSLTAGATTDLVTEQSWFRRGARRTLDAIDNLPGMVVYPTVRGGQALAIRGYASAASVRGIGLLLDGVPLTELQNQTGLYLTSNIELPTLDRIEVVRGPGSAVYGSDAFHGVLSLRTFAPDENRYEVGGEIGTDLFHRGFGRMSQSIGDDLRLDAAVGYSGLPDQDREYEYFDPITMMQATDERALAYRSLHGMARLRYAPSDKPVDGEVAFHSVLWRADEAVGLGAAAGVGANDVSNADSELYLARALVGVELPRDVRAEVSGYYWFLDVAQDTSLPLPFVAASTLQQFRSGARLTFRQEENRANTQWLLGYEFSRGKIVDSDQWLADPDTGIPIMPAADGPEQGFDRNIHSFLFSAQTALARQKLRLHYGGRLDYYSDFGVQVTPRVGVVVQPIEPMALKLLYGRAFRAPSAGEIRGAGGGIGAIPSPDIDPEIIDTVELVLQYQHDRFRVNLTGFGSLWHDGIQIVPLMPPQTQYQNVGESRAIGAEASFVYATEAFRVDASASYVRSENTTDDLEYVAFPDFIGNLGVGYTLASARLDFYLFQRVQVGASEGVPIANDPAFASSPDLPPYYRLDFHVAWEAVDDHLTVFANLRNAVALENRVTSLGSALGGAQTMGINASLGVNGAF